MSKLGAMAASSVAVISVLLLSSAPASSQIQITDASVEEVLRRAEEAYGQGRADEAARGMNRVTGWANHIRDVASGSRDPAADTAFAERIYLRVLATVGRTFGATDVNAGGALLGLAALYVEQRRYGEAEPLLRRAMGIVERAPAPSDDHRQAAVARVLGQMGLLEERRGRSAEAEAYYRRSLAIVERLPPRFRHGAGAAVKEYLRFLRENNRAQEAAAIEARFSR